MGLFDKYKKNSKEKLLKFLQERITKDTSLESIVATFEQMCSISVKEDMILFETGTFDFSGEERFYFSMVRQFPNDEEEFYQLHVDVLYEPTEKNKDYQQTVWNEEIDENIFEYIKSSLEYKHCKGDRICNLVIYLEET